MGAVAQEFKGRLAGALVAARVVSKTFTPSTPLRPAEERTSLHFNQLELMAYTLL